MTTPSNSSDNTALRGGIAKILLSHYEVESKQKNAHPYYNCPSCLDQILKIIQDNQEPELLEDFAEFCHEHYMGCSLEAGEDWAYSYDKEIVHLVPDYLNRPNHQEEKTL